MKKTLAASFIVTASLGCGPPGPGPNPPPIATVEPQPPEPETPPPVDAQPEPKDTETGGETGGEDLPEAKEGQKVVKQPDGTCMAYFEVDCPPPPVTCNPPPPMKVKCPPE